MKPDVGPTFTPLAAHPPADAIPELPQAAHPVVPIIPSVTARPPLADALIKAAQTQDFNLTRDLTLFARVRAKGGRPSGRDARPVFSIDIIDLGQSDLAIFVATLSVRCEFFI
jgi:hypothetical protein